MKCIVMYAAGMYEYLLKISSETQIFNFGYLLSRHCIYVSKNMKIRGYFLKPKGVHGQKSLGKPDIRDVHDKMGKQSSTSCVEVNVVGCFNFKHLVHHEFLEFNYVLSFLLHPFLCCLVMSRDTQSIITNSQIFLMIFQNFLCSYHDDKSEGTPVLEQVA